MKSTGHVELVRQVLPQAHSYSDYRQLVDELFRKGKTTGKDQSASMMTYTELNLARMNKWDKYFQLEDHIVQFLADRSIAETWLVITEAWCGDAAHAVPVMAKIAAASPAIDLKLVVRDDNLALMEHFHTEGRFSIPKLIRMNTADLSILSAWGPRPSHLQALFLEGKARGEDMQEAKKQMQIWYARNRGSAIMHEILNQLDLVVA